MELLFGLSSHPNNIRDSIDYVVKFLRSLGTDYFWFMDFGLPEILDIFRFQVFELVL